MKFLNLCYEFYSFDFRKKHEKYVGVIFGGYVINGLLQR
ncbi:hypothetical protein SDC9_88129 [bioreactor metagenome]|uniref:Uncharacterized protein n=1 Tax=bioreactor metagenome TaxID=1076179 RepID=A0A644ZV52_9ZZZZ